MFEKEAEEYKDNTRIKDKNTYIGFPYERISELQDYEGNYIDISERIIKAFKDGAEFGYNKAKAEMQEQGLALQSDMDKTIEQNIQLKKELNKANEWHYVKDGDLPNTDTKNYTYIRRRKRYERQFTDYRVIKCYVLCLNEKGKITAEVGYFDCNQKCFLDKAEGVIIAWKEIVLPELKESRE